MIFPKKYPQDNFPILGVHKAASEVSSLCLILYYNILIFFQDFDYIEDREGQEIDTNQGVSVIELKSVQDNFKGDILADFQDHSENSNLEDGGRSLTLIIKCKCDGCITFLECGVSQTIF